MVVTGLGIVGPLGIGWEETWSAALAGRSGAGPITRFDASDHACRIACEVRGFEPGDFVDRRSARRMDRASQMAVAARAPRPRRRRPGDRGRRRTAPGR